jgi:maltose alpha-D-glucosyltransferase/alpha-amylase
VKSEADGWKYTMDSLSRFFERAQTLPDAPQDALFGAGGRQLLVLSEADVPEAVRNLIGEYLERARLLGQRTGELHVALAGNGGDPDFAPEPISDFYRQGLYHGILALTTRVFQALRLSSAKLPENARHDAELVVGLEGRVRTRLRKFRDTKTGGLRIRVHGNYNLNEVLYTGKDFIITDFGGDPMRHLTERRMKRPPFFDVAGMLGSLYDAARAARQGRAPGIIHSPEDAAAADRWAECWYRWSSAALLKGYMTAVKDSRLLSPSRQEMGVLLDVFCLERFITQTDRCLTQDRSGLAMPLGGILQVAGDWPAPASDPEFNRGNGSSDSEAPPALK